MHVLDVSYITSSLMSNKPHLIVSYRIGTEHEKFGFEIETLRPMKYEQISELLNGISERFDWDKIMEGENIIGLQQVFLVSPISSMISG